MWEHTIVRIYVGSLPYETTSQDLIDLFGQVVGFVEMSNDQEARNAIDQLNGSSLGERTIVVNEARERREQQGGRGFQNRERRPGGGRDGYRDRRY